MSNDKNNLVAQTSENESGINSFSANWIDSKGVNHNICGYATLIKIKNELRKRDVLAVAYIIDTKQEGRRDIFYYKPRVYLRKNFWELK